jgi:hypothetical protein
MLLRNHYLKAEQACCLEKQTVNAFSKGFQISQTMRLSNLFSLFALSAASEVALYTSGSAVIARAIQPRAVNCKVIVGVLGVLKALGNPATSFCSSYLHIGTETVTSVVTPPAT